MEASDQHIDKRTKRADTTPNPEGSSLNTESPSEIVAMDYTLYDDLPPQLFDDVRTWLCRNLVLNSFFCLHPDNGRWMGELRGRLQTDLRKGHDLVAVLVEDHTKNHLMWDLRRWAVKSIASSDAAWEDYEFSAAVINEDAYNFHAWSHRKWVLRTFGGDRKDKHWEDELVYCAEIIGKDPFNSFAWDQRYFVLTRCLLEIEEARACEDDDRAEEVDEYFDNKRSEEVAYAIEAIDVEPGNQCPWSHIRGLYTAHTGSMTLDPRVRGTILRVLQGERDRLNDLGTMHDRFKYFMNARGIINALNALLDLLCYGYYSMIDEDEEMKDVLVALSPHSESESTSQGKVFQILEYVEKNFTACGLSWINPGPGLFARGLSTMERLFLWEKAENDYERRQMEES